MFVNLTFHLKTQRIYHVKFRPLIITLLGLISLYSMPHAWAQAQTAAPHASPQAVTPAAPTVVTPTPQPVAPTGQPATSVPLPRPTAPSNQMPPPPPPPPVVTAPIDYNSPGAIGVLPAKIDVSGIAAVVNGQPITNQMLVTRFLAAGAPTFLDDLINEQLIRQQAKKEGITVTPDELNERILEAKKILLPQYSGQSWAQFLIQQGRSEAYIKDLLYDGLLAQKLVARSLPAPNLTGKVHLYHILKLTVAVSGGPTPLPDAVAFKQISDIRALIVSGKVTFQQEARAESQDSAASSGGDLGWLDKTASLDPSFSKAAFALNEGEISQPVRSQYGWHLIFAAKFGAHANAADIAAYKDSKAVQDQARSQIQKYLKSLRSSSKVVDYALQLPPTPKPVNPFAHPVVKVVPKTAAKKKP
jgi:parvulin-like peptidyl-prolyl isomerase